MIAPMIPPRAAAITALAMIGLITTYRAAPVAAHPVPAPSRVAAPDQRTWAAVRQDTPPAVVVFRPTWLPPRFITSRAQIGFDAYHGGTGATIHYDVMYNAGLGPWATSPHLSFSLDDRSLGSTARTLATYRTVPFTVAGLHDLRARIGAFGHATALEWQADGHTYYMQARDVSLSDTLAIARGLRPL